MMNLPIDGTYVRSGGYPCAEPNCRTTGGYIIGGEREPRRRRGLCDSCYNHHLRRDTLSRFPLADRFITNPTPRTASPANRRAERIAEIAARVARHESIAGHEATPVAEESVNHAVVYNNAETLADAWLRRNPRQHLGISHSPDMSGWPVHALPCQAFMLDTSDAA
jgi:hypothetical protein